LSESHGNVKTAAKANDADTAVEITLAALPPGVTVRLDDNPTDSTVPVPPGRHGITLAAEDEQPRWFM